MAKKKKKKGGGGDDIPAWLITFSDMMTLLLTFFVLLNSMAVIDENRKLKALGSIIGTFGMGSKSQDVLATKDYKKTVEPGAMENVEDLEPLKPILWEEMKDDVRFAESKFVQVVSISADVLFGPGNSTLTRTGEIVLRRVLPVVKQVKYPILLGGHASELRDELRDQFLPGMDEATFSVAWNLSLQRTLSVFQFFIRNGVPADNMRMEAFGNYHPRETSKTEKGRRMNRRVDIVLDKRSVSLRQELDRVLPQGRNKNDRIDFDGFEFRINGTIGNNG